MLLVLQGQDLLVVVFLLLLVVVLEERQLALSVAAGCYVALDEDSAELVD